MGVRKVRNVGTDSLWEYKELDETDEAKNQEGTGDVGSKARVYFP